MMKMIMRLKCIKMINDNDIIIKHKELVLNIKSI